MDRDEVNKLEQQIREKFIREKKINERKKKLYLFLTVCLIGGLLMIVGFLFMNDGSSQVDSQSLHSIGLEGRIAQTVGADECGTLGSADTVYTLNSSVSSTGTCFTISGNNITLDGGGYTITYGTGGTGIGISVGTSSPNFTVKNSNIVKGAGGGGNNYGVWLNGADNSTVYNNVISTDGTSGNKGVYIQGDSMVVNITKNNITTTGSSSSNDGVDATSGVNFTITENIISTNGTSSNSGIVIPTGSSTHLIAHNIITTNGTSSSNSGIALRGNHSEIINNTIISDGTSSNQALVFVVASFNNATNNTLRGLGSGDSNHGFYVTYGSRNNYLWGNNVTKSTGGNAYGIRLENSDNTNNTFRSNIIANSGNKDLFIVTTSGNGTTFIDQDLTDYDLGSGNVISVERTGFGRIDYLEVVSGSGTNFTNDIRITNNSAIVESVTAAGLNSSANITLFGIGERGFPNPDILRDGVICDTTTTPSCSNFTALNDSTVIFNVSSWTEYSIGDPLAPTSCYDALIENGVYTHQNDFSTTGDCINVLANNVTINFNGFLIDGDDGGGDYGVTVNGYNDAIIFNGTTTDFGRGIYLSSSYNVTVYNMNLTSGSYGLFLGSNSVGSNITNIFGSGSTSRGFFLTGSDNNSVTNVNFKTGHFYILNSDNNVVTNVTVGSSTGSFTLLNNADYNVLNDIVVRDATLWALYMLNSDNNNLTNINASNEEVQFIGADDNNIINLTINNSPVDSLIVSSDRNIFTNLIILNPGANDELLLNTGAEDNVFIDSTIKKFDINGVNFTLQDANASVYFFGTVTEDNSNLNFNNGSAAVIFGNNSVTVDSVNAPGLNVSANITLFGIGGIPFYLPEIHREGVPCNATTGPSCHNFTSLEDSNVIFNVSSWTTYSIGNGTDVTPPNATLISPANGTITGNTTINFTANVSDDFAVDNATIFVYNETGLYNQTTVTLGGVLTAIVGFPIVMVNGIYQWFVQVFDTSSNSFQTGNNTLEIDTDIPTVSIVYPDNITYTDINVSQLNYAASDSNGLDACWFTLDGGVINTTITCGINATSLISNEGSNTWTIYANDTLGNEGSDSVTFFIFTTPQLIIEVIDPTASSINVIQNTTFEVSVNVTCVKGICDEVNVSLDPVPAKATVTFKDIFGNQFKEEKLITNGIGDWIWTPFKKLWELWSDDEQLLDQGDEAFLKERDYDIPDEVKYDVKYIQIEEPVKVSQGIEKKHYKWKYSNSSGKLIKSPLEFHAEWYDPNLDVKKLIVEFELIDESTGKATSVRGSSIIPLSYTGNFNFDLSKPGKFVDSKDFSIPSWEFSTNYVTVDEIIFENDTNIIYGKVNKFNKYKKLSNVDLFKGANGVGSLFLDPSISACASLTNGTEEYTLSSDVNSSGTCFTIAANNVSLDCAGFTINHSQSSAGFGVSLFSGVYNDTTIENCNIIQGNHSVTNAHGIRTNGNYDVTIRNNNVTGINSVPVVVSVATGTTIVGNNLTGNGSVSLALEANSLNTNISFNNIHNVDSLTNTISLASSNDTVFFSNNISSSGADTFSIVTNAQHNNITNNFINATGSSSADAFKMATGADNNNIISNEIYSDFFTVDTDTEGNNFSYNTISSVRGFRLLVSSNNLISNNIINITDSNAIGLGSSSDFNTISSNNITLFSSTADGISINGSDSNNISSNIVVTNGSNSEAILLSSSSVSNNISSNTLNTTGTSAQVIESSSSSASNIIENNEINSQGDNAQGIFFSGGSNTLVYGNTINTFGPNAQAILFTSTSGNNVSNNIFNIQGGSAEGLSISASSNNILTANNLTTNSTVSAVFITGNSDANQFTNNRLNATNNDVFTFNSSGANFPENNNLTGNTIIDNGFLQLEFIDDDINGTFLIDQPIADYNLQVVGNRINVKDTTFGEVRFLENVNQTGTNLSADIIILNNSISVDETTTPDLNRSAELTFFNMPTLSGAVILRNGATCNATTGPSCFNLTSLGAGGDITINVSSWSNYSIGGAPVVAGLKTGLISSTVGATPFYVNQSNPYPINLSAGQSTVVTWLVNATGDIGTNHTFFADANRTANLSHSNTTTRWTVNITGHVAPNITFVFPTEVSGTTQSNDNIEVNVTAVDDIAIDTISIFLFNSLHAQINTATSSISPLFNNFTSLADGLYYFNASANDTFNTMSFTETRNVTINTQPLSILVSPVERTYNTTTSILAESFCKYSNSTLCTAEVSCRLTSYYPNSSLLLEEQLMTNHLNGNYSYSVGFTNGSTNILGEYSSVVSCYVGATNTDAAFTFTVSDGSTPAPSPTTSIGLTKCKYRDFGYWNNDLAYFEESGCI